jgi:SRSO17 transposase
MALQVYSPAIWANDSARREEARVPAKVPFRTKPEIALTQIRQARLRGIPEGIVRADAGYGTDTAFRTELSKLELRCVVGVQSTMTVWKPDQELEPARPFRGTGRPPRLLQRDASHQPLSFV